MIELIVLTVLSIPLFNLVIGISGIVAGGILSYFIFHFALNKKSVKTIREAQAEAGPGAVLTQDDDVLVL